MAEDGAPGTALESFAKGNGLKTETPSLPAEGDLLNRDGTLEGGATGKLPGGEQGSVAYYTYTYTWTDSDHHTHSETRRFTMVVTRVPESIGFVPYLMFSGRSSQMAPSLSQSPEQFKLEEGDALDGTSTYVYKGSSHDWLTQLFSPALIDWLARSEDDFGFELCDGVLVVTRGSYLASGADLQTLCEDAGHVADALRKESREEIDTGGAKATAAKGAKKDVAVQHLIAGVKLSSEPEDMTAAKKEYRGGALRSPARWLAAFGTSLLILLVCNIFGAAIPILLAVNGATGVLAAIEGGLLLIIFFFVLRSQSRKLAELAAKQTFVDTYARSRGLKIEEPLQFAATHAESGLQFKPSYALSGDLPGGTSGSLAWDGTGEKRSDQIAVVAGPSGPVASAELQSDGPGLSAKTLDSYADRLGRQLKG